MRLLRRSMVCATLVCFAVTLSAAAQAADRVGAWDNPAADLARRIADQLGPSSAHLTFRNVSGISNESLPTIRRLLTDDLKTAGVTLTSGDSANAVHVTLSENVRGGVWIAEIVEGNQTRVVMVTLDRPAESAAAATQKVALHVQAIITDSALQAAAVNNGSNARLSHAVLAAAQTNGALVVLFPSRIAVFDNTPQGWTERAHADLGVGRGVSRDPRGVINALPDGSGFEAFAPGIACSGTYAPAAGQGAAWTLHCHPSDDPWPLAGSSAKAFYNSARDFYTGAISPSSGFDLPPFYAAGVLPNRAAGPALLAGAVEGKVILAEHGELKPVAGTRDWGSYFAVVSSACGAGAEVIVSSSGEGKSESLRAYEIPAQEALAVSDTLQMPGAVMAMSPAADGKSAVVIVRKPADNVGAHEYEVDRVTATCN
ncbi:MAG TPA: hypothetical protein VGL22_03560 [Terracidiphilus sp.]